MLAFRRLGLAAFALFGTRFRVSRDSVGRVDNWDCPLARDLLVVEENRWANPRRETME